jgi:hypothetical protein
MDKKIRQLITRIKSHLIKLNGEKIKKVILYGSYVRGEAGLKRQQRNGDRLLARGAGDRGRRLRRGSKLVRHNIRRVGTWRSWGLWYRTGADMQVHEFCPKAQTDISFICKSLLIS